MFQPKHYIYSILIGVFIVSNILFSQTATGANTMPVVGQDTIANQATTEIITIDSTLYLKLFYSSPIESPIVYADTLILESDVLPFIFNKNRIDLVPLTPPLFQKHYLSMEEQFLPGKLFSDRNNRNYVRKKTYNEIIDNHPELIKYSREDLAGEVEKISEIEPTIHNNLFKIDYEWDLGKVDKPERYRPKRRYWIFKGNHFLQFSQTDDSKNWDKAGLGNINLLSTHSLGITYQKNKPKIEQFFEWRFHIANNQNDTLRWHKILEDRFRSYTTVGLQAFKHWSYSANMEFITQLFPNYIENRKDIVASFLSPFYINSGIGMNYSLNKTYPNKSFPKLPGKKVAFTTDISPLSIQYINLLKSVANPARFGVKEGSSQLDFGTTINAKLLINYSKNMSYMARAKFFSNYKKVNTELENDLNLPLNRYFSVRLYFFVTFDDTRDIDPKYGYIQFKETFSFGFNYAW